MEKWQVPSCEECDRKSGDIDTDLRWRLGLGVDPAAPESLGIAQSVHRSFDPSSAKRERDRRARKQQINKLRDSVIPLSMVQPDNVLPNFGPVPGTPNEDLVPIGIPTTAWEAFGIKSARGAMFVLDASYIEENQRIDVLPPMLEHDKRAKKIRIEHGTCHRLGPGFTVGKGLGFAEKKDSQLFTPVTLFRFDIWGKVQLYVEITH